MTVVAHPGGMAADGGTTDSAGSTSLSLSVTRLPGIAMAAAASLGAGAIHAAAAGIHSEHVGLTRLFVLTALLQIGTGVIALVRPTRLAAAAVAAVNAAAVTGWLVTRLTGIDFISGLETREAAQFTDTTCALLGAVAVAAALAAALVGWRPSREPRLAFAGIAVAALAVPAMFTATTHSHSGDGHSASADGHSHDSPVAGSDTTVHDDSSGDHTHGTTVHDDSAGDDHPHGTTVITDDAGEPVWPRPWDPADDIDISGVPGVTPEQEARAVTLIEGSLRELPKWSTTAAAEADGYRSIGDAGTGSEHFIKATIVQDDVLLDPTQPESLVYSVAKDGTKTLAGAMFIASMRPTDDPELTNWAGPLMQWHNHGNLCWDAGKVVGVVDANGKCARGNNGGGEFPMVHVWITPHPCGVFAALEGVGAGQTSVPEDQRVDMCNEGHHDSTPAAEPKPYDPTMPIDLSGTPGVTPQQQAAAENLIAITLIRLPQWSDYKVAEAAGFSSIGDGLTGHEHFINWKWIDDDVILNPDFPESLVYEPQPDGSKKLVSAMFMLPTNVALEDAPDIGGALMQWHIHDNLCFTGGDTPRVAGLTTSGGACPEGLEKLDPAAMIHVWITPHKCGPFAALEGVGAGQVKPGEEHLCDHAHGA